MNHEVIKELRILILIGGLPCLGSTIALLIATYYPTTLYVVFGLIMMMTLMSIGYITRRILKE